MDTAIPEPEALVLLSKARLASQCGAGLAIRLASGLSQAEVARSIGVTQGTLSRWENRLASPRGAAAIEYGRFLERLSPSSEHA